MKGLSACFLQLYEKNIPIPETRDGIVLYYKLYCIMNKACDTINWNIGYRAEGSDIVTVKPVPVFAATAIA